MTIAFEVGRPLQALLQRVHAVAAVFMPEPSDMRSVGGDPAEVLEAMVKTLQASPNLGHLWLLLTAVMGSFPRPEEVQTARRHFEHQAPRDAVVWLLHFAGERMSLEDAGAEIALVTESPVVDVDFSAQSDLSTGIQRVVRQLVPRWGRIGSITLVRWENAKMFVGLSEAESKRVLGQGPSVTDGSRLRLVPWGVPVLLLEVPFAGHGDRLAAVAQFSPNPVRAIGYDCIPMVSADLVSAGEQEKFGEYLELVKYADIVAGISKTAAMEFGGFVGALASQGLPGPTVVSCALPTTEVLPAPSTSGRQRDLPEVLCVGTMDRRKNQIALVEAAEHLWREGLSFRLRMIGFGGGPGTELHRLVEDLLSLGRPIEVDRGAPDHEIDEAYRSARVFVFPTRHEGFGLPVVEALSYGVPVITSDFGSTREIAEGNGGILINPEDMGQFVDVLRRVLTDDELHARLVAQTRQRPHRTWDDYAAELWELFVQ